MKSILYAQHAADLSKILSRSPDQMYFSNQKYFAESVDVRILPNSNVYEQHFLLRQELFSNYFEGLSESDVTVI